MVARSRYGFAQRRQKDSMVPAAVPAAVSPRKMAGIVVACPKMAGAVMANPTVAVAEGSEKRPTVIPAIIKATPVIASRIVTRRAVLKGRRCCNHNACRRCKRLACRRRRRSCVGSRDRAGSGTGREVIDIWAYSRLAGCAPSEQCERNGC